MKRTPLPAWFVPLATVCSKVRLFALSRLVLLASTEIKTEFVRLVKLVALVALLITNANLAQVETLSKSISLSARQELAMSEPIQIAVMFASYATLLA